MGLFLALFFGAIFAIGMPTVFAGSTGTVGQMLAGGPLTVPFTTTTLTWSWAVFWVVSILIYGLIKMAGK